MKGNSAKESRRVTKGPVVIPVIVAPSGEWGVPFGRHEITYEGEPLEQRTRSVLTKVLTDQAMTPEAKDRVLRDLLYVLLEACLEVSRVQPEGSLCSRDVADRIFEAVTTPAWGMFNGKGHDELALRHALWVVHAACDWENSISAPPRRVHKGSAYFWAAISSVKAGNVDLGLRLLESGDAEDSATYLAAHRSEAGVKFPGRMTMQLDPSEGNYLRPMVLQMRRILGAWVDEFNRDSGVPPPDRLSLEEMDRALLRNPARKSEARYLFGYMLWTNIMVQDPRFSWIPGGLYSMRRRAEWVLGLLTATEGIVRLREDGTRAGEFGLALAELVAGGEGSTEFDPWLQRMKAIMDPIKKVDTVQNCLDFWEDARERAPRQPAGLPWFMSWLEPARFLRNQAAHLVGADPGYVNRWPEVDRVARYALFTAVWLIGKPRQTTRRQRTTRGETKQSAEN